MSVDYSAVLADLRAKRDKLTAAIEAIEELQGEAPRATVVTPRAAHIAPSRKQRSGTVASIAHELIRTHGGPMKVSDIVRALQGMGKFKTIDARSNYGTVFGTLNDDHARFVKAGEGMFEIRERSSVHQAALSAASMARQES